MFKCVCEKENRVGRDFLAVLHFSACDGFKMCKWIEFTIIPGSKWNQKRKQSIGLRKRKEQLRVSNLGMVLFAWRFSHFSNWRWLISLSSSLTFSVFFLFSLFTSQTQTLSLSAFLFHLFFLSKSQSRKVPNLKIQLKIEAYRLKPLESFASKLIEFESKPIETHWNWLQNCHPKPKDWRTCIKLGNWCSVKKQSSLKIGAVWEKSCLFLIVFVLCECIFLTNLFVQSYWGRCNQFIWISQSHCNNEWK